MPHEGIAPCWTSRFPRTGGGGGRASAMAGAAIGLTNYLGHYDAHANRTASVAAVRLAATEGLTYFDTAPGYGSGLSEEIFGEALDGDRGPDDRDEGQSRPGGTDVRASLEGKPATVCGGRASTCCRSTAPASTTRPAVLFSRAGGMLDQMRRVREGGACRRHRGSPPRTTTRPSTS